MNENVIELLDGQCESAWASLIHEINTDENSDYRRGFRAGRLVSALELKADIIHQLQQHEIQEK